MKNDYGYDIIGDVHGHADALERILLKLGYTEKYGVYTHKTRQAIFVGDFIDRGPKQLRAIEIGMRMCRFGSALAVMGNHELNAIGWARKNASGEPYRIHDKKNLKQHQRFLEEITDGSLLHEEIINWFVSLPIWIDLPELRVIHACWHEASQDKISPYLDQKLCLYQSSIPDLFHRGSEAFNSVEILLKGPEIDLPSGSIFFDEEGNKRNAARIEWWLTGLSPPQDASGPGSRDEKGMLDHAMYQNYRYGAGKPVIFGHYWLKGTPSIDNPRAACIDYSVAKNNYLAAYRWSGENLLKDENIIYVRA